MTDVNTRDISSIYATFSVAWKSRRFQTSKVILKVTQGHRYWRHHIGHIQCWCFIVTMFLYRAVVDLLSPLCENKNE